jgi:hypothetical protein
MKLYESDSETPQGRGDLKPDFKFEISNLRTDEPPSAFCLPPSLRVCGG